MTFATIPIAVHWSRIGRTTPAMTCEAWLTEKKRCTKPATVLVGGYRVCTTHMHATSLLVEVVPPPTPKENT